MFLPGRECDLQGDGLCDDGIGSAIEKSKGYQWNQICLEFVFSGKVSVNETVSSERVNTVLYLCGGRTAV